jgi:hypothetical protein
VRATHINRANFSLSNEKVFEERERRGRGKFHETDLIYMQSFLRAKRDYTVISLKLDIHIKALDYYYHSYDI